MAQIGGFRSDSFLLRSLRACHSQGMIRFILRAEMTDRGMIDPVERALMHLRQQSLPGADEVPYPITINFHPDIAVSGERMIDLLVAHGSYRSQFETGTSSGGLTAFRGGDRWNWESSIFGFAYDEAHPSLRPKYGALNHRHDRVGGSRRFGSCHLRMAPHVRARTSFCYPDSHLRPRDFAVDNVRRLT